MPLGWHSETKQSAILWQLILHSTFSLMAPQAYYFGATWFFFCVPDLQLENYFASLINPKLRVSPDM